MCFLIHHTYESLILWSFSLSNCGIKGKIRIIWVKGSYRFRFWVHYFTLPQSPTHIIAKWDSYYKSINRGGKFLFRRPFFGRAILLGFWNLKCMSNRYTTRNIAFCSLLPKKHPEPLFLVYFHRKFSQRGFCSLNIVLTYK